MSALEAKLEAASEYEAYRKQQDAEYRSISIASSNKPIDYAGRMQTPTSC